MNNHTYWHRQTPNQPLYPDFEWIKPEQKTKSGKLGIVGGQKIGILAVNEAYETANKNGAGAVKILLPDALKKTLPKDFEGASFGPTNLSGSLSKEAINELVAMGDWSDVTLFIGDCGRSSETSILYETFLSSHEGPVVITRDAFDILRESNKLLLSRDKTLLVLSFAQLQKLFQLSYYPIVLTFSMQLAQLVEALHKLTITYPVSITVLHKDNLVIARAGEVVSTPWNNAMAIWRGQTATKMATYWMWQPNDPLMCFAASII